MLLSAFNGAVLLLVALAAGLAVGTVIHDSPTYAELED